MRVSKTGVVLVACAMLLCGGRFAAGQDAKLDVILDRTGQLVAKFLVQISDVKCTEQVLQQKLDKDGHVEVADHSSYDYLVMLQGDGDDFLLNESRIEQKSETGSKKILPLLLTNGFSSLYLIFHPYYRSSFHFAADGVETLEGRSLMRVSFAHISGTRTPAAVSVRGREYPLELSGTAWIVPETGAIVHIRSGLQSDMKDVGLRSLTADVEYAPARLEGVAGNFLFPAVATIDVQSLRQHWRNTHRFDGYMQFSVDAKQMPDSKVQAK